MGEGGIVTYTVLHLASDVKIPPFGAYLQEQHRMTAILLTNCQFHLALVRNPHPHASHLNWVLSCYPDTFLPSPQNILLRFLMLQALQFKEEASVKPWMMTQTPTITKKS